MCNLDIDIFFFFFLAKEIRGVPAFNLWYSSLKRFLPLATVANCPQYVKNVVYELRQYHDMTPNMRALYEANPTSVDRETIHDGEVVCSGHDEMLEAKGVKISKEVNHSENQGKIEETGKQLNYLSGVMHSVREAVFDGVDDDNTSYSRNRLNQLEQRLWVMRSIFRQHVFSAIKKEVN